MTQIYPRIASASSGNIYDITSTPTPSTPSTSTDSLSVGAVAVIVVGVAVAVALVTFLTTFLAMRQEWLPTTKKLRKKSRPEQQERTGTLPFGSITSQTRDLKKRMPFGLEIAKSSNSYESHLPKSADDQTVELKTKIMFDELELHVENFYGKTAEGSFTSTEADFNHFDTLDSGQLPDSLSSLSSRTRNMVPIVKHTLAFVVTTSISRTMYPKWPLLPEDLVLLPRAVAAPECLARFKPGFEQCLSRWRVMTSYLRPDPSEDDVYIEYRDARIKEIVRTFSSAFRPWRKHRYTDEDQTQSLSTILQEVASLGIWFFSQPSDLRFRWPAHQEMDPAEIAISPALLKITDELGRRLPKPVHITGAVVQKA